MTARQGNSRTSPMKQVQEEGVGVQEEGTTNERRRDDCGEGGRVFGLAIGSKPSGPPKRTCPTRAF